MGDSASETVPCHYCGAEVDVPRDRTRFEAFTAHFETEHIRARPVTSRERRGEDLPSDPGNGADDLQKSDDTRGAVD